MNGGRGANRPPRGRGRTRITVVSSGGWCVCCTDLDPVGRAASCFLAGGHAFSPWSQTRAPGDVSGLDMIDVLFVTIIACRFRPGWGTQSSISISHIHGKTSQAYYSEIVKLRKTDEGCNSCGWVLRESAQLDGARFLVCPPRLFGFPRPQTLIFPQAVGLADNHRPLTSSFFFACVLVFISCTCVRRRALHYWRTREIG